MPDPVVKLKGHEGSYDVYLDGTLIGRVRRFETRYNLRRALVVRDWRAFSEKTGKVESRSYGGGYEKRAEAVAALVEHTIGKPEKVT